MQPVMKNMTVKQLRYLDAAARHGSIAAAAVECNISQSSIVNAIDAVEHELAFNIFLREPSKGIQITPAGEVAIQVVQKFLGAARSMEGELAAIGHEVGGQLVIGCSTPTATCFLAELIRGFSAAHPQVELIVVDAPPEKTISNLGNGKIDIAICYRDACPGKLFHRLFSAAPIALINKEHPLSKRSVLELRELADIPLIELAGANDMKFSKGLFSKEKLQPVILQSIFSHELAISMVEVGQGYMVTTSDIAAGDPCSARYAKVAIRTTCSDRQVGLAFNFSEKPRKTVHVFAEYCEELAQGGWFENITGR